MGWVVNAMLRALYPRERPGTHCRWAPGLVWRGAENLEPPPGFDPRTVQPVASRYTPTLFHNISCATLLGGFVCSNLCSKIGYLANHTMGSRVPSDWHKVQHLLATHLNQ